MSVVIFNYDVLCTPFFFLGRYSKNRLLFCFCFYYFYLFGSFGPIPLRRLNNCI